MATPPRTAASPDATDPVPAVARAAAERAGIEIRDLHLPAELAAASELAARVWRSPDTCALDTGLLRALAHSGNFVVGAFDGVELVGLSVGFRTGHPVAGLHSHMTCTSDARRGAGLGYALKLHQRAWALAQDLAAITWTFDPLVRRNAYFNLVKLGAEVKQYLPDFYGPLGDGVNAGDESDRILVTWRVTAEAVPAGASTFEPADANVRLTCAPGLEPLASHAEGDQVGAQVPPDIVELRVRQPRLARRWRHALRTSLLDAFADGYRVDGFTRSGYYLLRR